MSPAPRDRCRIFPLRFGLQLRCLWWGPNAKGLSHRHAPLSPADQGCPFHDSNRGEEPMHDDCENGESGENAHVLRRQTFMAEGAFAGMVDRYRRYLRATSWQLAWYDRDLREDLEQEGRIALWRVSPVRLAAVVNPDGYRRAVDSVRHAAPPAHLVAPGSGGQADRLADRGGGAGDVRGAAGRGEAGGVDAAAAFRRSG